MQNLEIENARIIFRNFSGAETKYNRAGDRNFCVIIDDEEQVQNLIDDGWNIRILKPREDGDKPAHYLPVSLKFNKYPPKVHLITRKSNTILDEDDIGMLDYADLENVDLIIRPYDWTTSTGSGRKAYLKTGYFTLEENRFSSKYSGELSDDEMPFD